MSFGVSGFSLPLSPLNATKACVGASVNVMHVDAHVDDVSNAK